MLASTLHGIICIIIWIFPLLYCTLSLSESVFISLALAFHRIICMIIWICTVLYHHLNLYLFWYLSPFLALSLSLSESVLSCSGLYPYLNFLLIFLALTLHSIICMYIWIFTVMYFIIIHIDFIGSHPSVYLLSVSLSESVLSCAVLHCADLYHHPNLYSFCAVL